MDEAADRMRSEDPVREALQRFGADELDYRLAVDPEDPRAVLAIELNQMAERLQRRREEVIRAVEFYCLRRFGTVLVHDLKNLAARLTFVPHNLRKDVGDAEVVEACATTVEDTARKIEALVRRFRDQREAMVLKIRGDINRTVEAAVDNAGLRSTPGVKLELCLGQLPETVLDGPYLEEALVNVLRNAVEAMGGSGHLKVTTVASTDRAGRPLAELTIADDGPGMTKDFIDRELFTPFRSTKRNGMGLGMFSCRETVELHGGRIEVDSAPGQGTTFRISLPIREEEAPSA